MGTPTSAGGAAASKGVGFEDRVAAWAAVRILAEQAAPPPWDLPPTHHFATLGCQTAAEIDDVLVRTTADGYAFFQLKRGVALLQAPDSPLRAALSQIVRQFLACRSHAGG